MESPDPLHSALLQFLASTPWYVWVALLGFAVLIWRLPIRRFPKIGLTFVVLLGFTWTFALEGLRTYRRVSDLAVSVGVFNQRCKAAGEVISSTADGVDGIVWTKWRSTRINDGDQFLKDDPYGYTCGAEQCIESLLKVFAGSELNSDEAKRHSRGYAFVETRDPADHQLYRYRGVIKFHHRLTPEQIEEARRLSGKEPAPEVFRFALEREAIAATSAAYGVSWEDVSTDEDRKHWIAGGSIRIIDARNGRELARRTGYMIDQGQGSKSGDRSPWTWTHIHGPRCPSEPAPEPVSFALRVLRPR